MIDFQYNNSFKVRNSKINMGKKLEVKFITASNENLLENDLRIFAMENPYIEINSTSHVVSHFEPGVYGPGRTEKHYYTIWYSKEQ